MNIIHGDSLDKLKELEDNSVDSIVSDPPYGLSFMGKKWDYDVPSQEIWEECLRVLKPGGYLLAFAGTRTQHRMAVRIEDAGFEIRDMIMYLYGSGFPKSLNVWKQLKKNCKCGIMEEYEESRNERGVSLQQESEHDLRFMWERNLSQTINPQQEQGKVLQSSLSEQSISVSRDTTSNDGRGQSSLERWDNNEKTKGKLPGSKVCEVSKKISINGKEGRIHNGTQIGNGSTHREVIREDRSSTPRRPQSKQQQDRKPCTFCEQHFAQAIRAYGFGSAIKPSCEPITLARKPISEKNIAQNVLKYGTGGINIDGCRVGMSTEDKEMLDAKSSKNPTGVKSGFGGGIASPAHSQGRFPANLIHDGSDEVVNLFPNVKGQTGRKQLNDMTFQPGQSAKPQKLTKGVYDSDSAARFFYCAKASKSERNKGLEGFEEKQTTGGGGLTNVGDKFGSIKAKQTNSHPTVKPISLMRYLCRLVTPKGGTVLDPFMGSGTTGIGAKLEGFDFIGIEREAEYIKIAEARINAWEEDKQKKLIG